MRRTSLVLAVCFVCCFGFTWVLASNSFAEDFTTKPSAPVEVAYFIIGSTIQTYDVAASTGLPTQEGQPLTLPTNAPYVTPSKNDHFLYVQGNYNAFHIWVYATNSTGVPEFPPVQSMALPKTFGPLQFAPNGRFAYAVKSAVDAKGNTLASMRLFNVDQASGTLSLDPNAVATYPANGPCLYGYPGSLQVLGFNRSGSRLHEDWICSFPGNTGEIISYTRQVDPQTGGLGPAVLNLTTYQSDSSDAIVYTPKSILDFSINYGGPPGSNLLSVYPLSGGATPLFACNASMLEACGFALRAIPDLSGNFVFLNLSDSDTQIAQVNLSTKTITDTGYSVLGSRQYFSPDDLLVYSEVSDACTTNCPIYIYTFDNSSGAVITHPGSIINSSTYASSIVPATRR
jgi:hypothetical protein